MRADEGLVVEETDTNYIDKLVEFVWMKVNERHKNTTHAFRFFDVKGKGKLRRADLVEGFDKLRIKLSNSDFEKFWSFLDYNKRGRVTFNDFCALGDQRTLKLTDPFSLLHLEQNIQDNLAKERAEERDRIAQDLIERMSKVSKVTSSEYEYTTGKKMKDNITAVAKQQI